MQTSERAQEMRAARNAVLAARMAGTLPHPHTSRCELCGRRGECYHHFRGYAPEHHLDVTLYCRGCHSRQHIKERKLALALGVTPRELYGDGDAV
jgi:hypothetical protein